jgi:hypothetical protein
LRRAVPKHLSTTVYGTVAVSIEDEERVIRIWGCPSDAFSHTIRIEVEVCSIQSTGEIKAIALNIDDYRCIPMTPAVSANFSKGVRAPFKVITPPAAPAITAPARTTYMNVWVVIITIPIITPAIAILIR